jgi:putative membrane protein
MGGTIDAHVHGTGAGAEALAGALVAPFVVALVLYLCAAHAERRGPRGWPWHRDVLWTAGVCAAAAGLVGPLADSAHRSFPVHMAAHLVVGMAAPVLLVLAAPVTLALRTLSAVPARRVSRALRSAPARVLTHPVTAALLNIGGLSVLYLTPLHAWMGADPVLHVLVTGHLLVAGYLYTAALISLDPAPHRASYALRSVVFVLALAAHGILAKLLYAHPPVGVPAADAQAGAQLMYYGGDVVEAALLVVLLAQWYRASGRRLRGIDGVPASLAASSGVRS